MNTLISSEKLGNGIMDASHKVQNLNNETYIIELVYENTDYNISKKV